MWNPHENTDDENLRWCYIRALEWASWPTFISQPIAPVAILFFPWWSVAIATVVATALWMLFIRHRFVSPAAAYWGALFVRLKWITCPVAAFFLWSRGSKVAAVVALLWPLVILVMPWPLMLFGLGPGRVGDIQTMFMRHLGYEPASET